MFSRTEFSEDILGEREEEPGDWRKLHNSWIEGSYPSPERMMAIEARSMR